MIVYENITHEREKSNNIGTVFVFDRLATYVGAVPVYLPSSLFL